MTPQDPHHRDSSGRTWGSPAPAPLLVAASISFVQGLLVVMGALAEAFTISSDRIVPGLTITVFFTLYGGVLLLCSWGLTRLRPFARGPVLLAQLVWLGLAWNLRGTPLVSVVLVVFATIVLVGLLHPRSMAAIEQSRAQE